MPTQILKTGPEELYRQLKGHPGQCIHLLENARTDKMTVTRRLNQIIDVEKECELDGFELMLREAKIRTNSDEESGYFASPASEFLSDSAARFLLVEYAQRKTRQAVFNSGSVRKAVSEQTPGSLARKYFDESEIEWTQRIAPSIPLDQVASRTQGINAPDYRSYHLTYSATGLRMYRTAEGAEIPEASIAKADHTIELKKYARAIRLTYEWLLTIPVDELGEEIQFVIVQLEVDKLAAFIDVCINGDGNSGTSATNHNLTTLDPSASPGTLTGKGFSAFKKKFTDAYILNRALMQDTIATDLELVTSGSADTPLYRYPNNELMPINTQAREIGYGWTGDAPASTILGLDNRRSPKHLYWVDADIQETQRFITNQTEVLTLSEYSGFSVRDANASRTLTVSA